MSARDLLIFSANSKHTGLLRIDGNPVEDQTLTAISTIADADGMGALHYRWFIGDSLTNRTGPIGTDSPTLPLTYAEKDKYIFCEAYYTDLGGDTEIVLSINVKGPVLAVDHPPTGTLNINGNLTVGSVITATVNNLADPDGLGPIHYQWYSGNDPVGTDTATYTTLTSDIGKNISFTISYVDGRGNTFLSAKGPSIGPIVDVNSPMTGRITIQGGFGAVGNIIDILPSSISSLADTDGMGPITYEWYSGGTLLFSTTDATKTYTVTSSDIGKDIYILTKQIDNKGNPESSKSNVITIPIPPPTTGPVIGSPTFYGEMLTGNTLVAVIRHNAGGSEGIYDPDGIPDSNGMYNVNYQWYSGILGTIFTDKIGTNSPTYTIQDSDIGKWILVTIYYTDKNGNSESTGQDSSTTIKGPVVKTNVPVIDMFTSSGIPSYARTGDQLGFYSANLTQAQAAGLTGYEWRIGKHGGISNPIVGQSPTYQVTAADEDKVIVLILITTHDGITERLVTNYTYILPSTLK